MRAELPGVRGHRVRVTRELNANDGRDLFIGPHAHAMVDGATAVNNYCLVGVKQLFRSEYQIKIKIGYQIMQVATPS